MAGQHSQGPHQVMEVGAPLPPELHVLPVHLKMGIQRDGSGVGVVSGHDVAPSIAQHVEPLGHGGGISRRLQHHVHSPVPGEGEDPVLPVPDVGGEEIEGGVHPEAAGQPKAVIGGADHEDLPSSPEVREGRGGEPHRSRALHQHHVAHGKA